MVDFLGIGVQKGGTTWLYHQLQRHPQIAFPGGKEVHFWDRVDPALASRWLEALQPATRVTPDGRPIRCGEITPSYATLDAAPIAAIQRTCPVIRLFISLRNPLARAWSAALMGLMRCQMKESEASDQWFIDHFRSQASRQRGAYAATLTRWWEVFPREQLLVILLDDIASKPVAVLAALAHHIRVDEADFAALPPTDLAAMILPRIGSLVAPEHRARVTIRTSLIPVLQDLYGPEIERLSGLLNRDLAGWLADPLAGSAAPEHGAAVTIGCGGPGTTLTDSLSVSHPRRSQPS